MAIVLTCYYRPKAGGFCLRLFRAMQALLVRGHTVHYVSLAPFPIQHPRCIYHRFPWPPHMADNLLFWAIFHMAAPWLLGFVALRHQVTHAFAFGTTYAFLMRPLQWIKAVHLTCFLRSDALVAHGVKKRAGWLVRLEYWIEGLALHRADVVGTTPQLVQAVTRRHPRMAVKSRYHLPNDLPSSAGAQNKLRSEKPLRLAMVGILEEQKNQAFIIHILKQYQGSDWVLRIYGQGPLEDDLKALVRGNNLQARVRFMGWVPSEHIWPHIDLLLMPSLQEWMPNAVLEAVANKVPVLASDIEGHRQILPPSHLLALNRPDQWQAALRQAMTDPQGILPPMRKAQFRFAEYLRFDWDACAVSAILHAKKLS